MKPNHVKKLLQDGKFTCGSWVSLCSPTGAEVMGLMGFDWLLIDMEHGGGDYQTLLTQLQGVAASSDTVPFVRVQWNDHVVIKRVLDMGAYGVMVPGIRTAEEAKAAVAAIKYPPEGMRGIAGNRGARFGQDKDYVTDANREIMMILQIENKESIDNIEAILDVPGIDVVFLGPNDLSADMGHVGHWDHPEVLEAIKTLNEAAHRRNLPLGTVSRNWEGAKTFIDQGYRFMSLMGDIPFMFQAGKAAVATFREHPDVAKS